MISGSTVKIKNTVHTWVEGMTESEEIAYALTNAKKKTEFLISKPGPRQGVRNTIYNAKFSDGCRVQLIREDPFLIGDVPYDNHLTAVLINPKF